MNYRVVVQEPAFSQQDEYERLRTSALNVGAVVTFAGTVRDINDDDTVTALRLEHYPGMTEKALTDIAQQAVDRWSLGDALVIHRYGDLAPGEMIMMVATASKHRKNAFEAAVFLMDFLKSRAPFWKKEFLKDGAEWVAAKQEDEDSLDRWTD